MKIYTIASRSVVYLSLLVFVTTSCSKSESEPPPKPNEAPSGFEITITDLQQTQATVSWTASTDPEGKAISYTVVLGTDTVSRQSAQTIVLTNLTENKNYTVTVLASDPEKATTKKEISFTTAAYSIPSAFTVSTQQVGGSIATINWTASTLPDNAPLLYDVYLDGQLTKANLTNNERSFAFSKLKELTSYSVKVVAKSNFNKTQESTVTFTTGGDPAPTGLGLQVPSVSYSLAKFSIGAASDAEGQAITYSVFLDNQNISQQLEPTISSEKEYIIHSLLPEKSYAIKIRATDEGGKTTEKEVSIVTLKQPILVINNKSIVKTETGFVYNLQTDVDYKPSKIILYANGVAINTQPTSSSVINGNTISYTYTNSYLTGDGNFSIASNLFWGDDTEKSRTATFDNYSYYNFKPSNSSAEEGKIDAASANKPFFVFFTNKVISNDPNYSIVEVVFGTQTLGFSIYRTGDTTGYITGFLSPSQYAAIEAGSKTGYVVMKDFAGYHKLEFAISNF